MGDYTSIEWTDATWNPIRGCSRVSEGCRNCYAERVAARFSGPGQPYEGLAVMKDHDSRWTGKVRFIEEHLADPLRWKRPRRIFVNSMSDLFHEKVQDEWLVKIFNVMVQAQHHTFQCLTKRPERMRDWMKHLYEGRLAPAPPHNVWMGVSVEDQKTADDRIPLLLQTPATVRWVSYEPALDHVYFDRYLRKATDESVTLDWIVCGGESGPSARPMHPDWARNARDQCQAAGVPFLFKQWGEWSPGRQSPRLSNNFMSRKPCQRIERDDIGVGTFKVGKKAAGRLLDGREWNEYPLATNH